MAKKIEDVIQKYDEYYETVTRNTRWLIFAAAMVTVLAVENIDLLAVSIIGVLGLYNIIRYLPPFKNIWFFYSKANTLIIDTVFVVTLVNISGVLQSPYIVLLIIPVMSSVFWYGIKGMTIVILVELLAIGGAAFISLPTFLPIDYIRGGGIKIVTLLIAAFMAERLTVVERGHRKEATDLYNEVEDERQKLLTLIHSMAEPVIAVDEEGKVTLYNAAALELINTNEDITDKTLNKILPFREKKPDDEEDRAINVLEEAKKTPGAGIYHNRDLVYGSSDQGTLNIEVSVAPIRPVDSVIHRRASREGYIIILRDITKVKTLEEQRDEFVSVISHELKTPVAVAEADLSTLLMPDYAPKEEKPLQLLEDAHEKVIFLGELIKDLTILTRVEQQAIKLEFEHLDPSEVTEEVVNEFQDEAKQKDLDIKVDIKKNLPKVLSSPDFVKEVLQNLISNAIKYTEKGTVNVSVEKSIKRPGGIVFKVQDSGIGISASDQKKIFEKFFRAEDYKTKHIRGTGLGLYLVKKIADRLNAKIWFESKLKQGTTFYFELPPHSERKEDHAKVVEAEATHLVENI